MADFLKSLFPGLLLVLLLFLFIPGIFLVAKWAWVPLLSLSVLAILASQLHCLADLFAFVPGLLVLTVLDFLAFLSPALGFLLFAKPLVLILLFVAAFAMKSA